MAAVYGLIWGLAWRVLGRRTAIPAWLGGLVYGLLLWGGAQLLVRSFGSGLAQLTPAALLTGHLAYGLVLGFLSRNR